MEDNDLLHSILSILGSDPLLQVNRLQMYESKFHELSDLYKISTKKLKLMESSVQKFWPELVFKSTKDFGILDRKLKDLFDNQLELSMMGQKLSEALEEKRRKEYEMQVTYLFLNIGIIGC
jgi:hypothetical protein